MKTKIIYISGNEVFEMTEIRAAFEEVREALGLNKDTILFGVPVDCDNALESTQTIESENVVENAVEEEPILVDNVTPIQEDVMPVAILTKAPVEKPVQTQVNDDEDIVCQPVQDESECASVVSEPAQNEKIIPILSVLAATETNAATSEETIVMDDTITVVTEDAVETTTQDETAPILQEEIKEEIVAEQKHATEEPVAIISDISIDATLITPDDDEQPAEKVTISDMINDDAPVPQMKKTLEQLLESMTPLREDIHNVEEDKNIDDFSQDIPMFDENDTDAADATLAQLASEFAKNEDKIPVAPKTETQGKIGKLKNILPFKKQKRDDSGLMGDLFGWAGIAANDDDFSMPGFFANAKKQGA